MEDEPEQGPCPTPRPLGSGALGSSDPVGLQAKRKKAELGLDSQQFKNPLSSEHRTFCCHGVASSVSATSRPRDCLCPSGPAVLLP